MTGEHRHVHDGMPPREGALRHPMYANVWLGGWARRPARPIRRAAYQDPGHLEVVCAAPGLGRTGHLCERRGYELSVPAPPARQPALHPRIGLRRERGTCSAGQYDAIGYAFFGTSLSSPGWLAPALRLTLWTASALRPPHPAALRYQGTVRPTVVQEETWTAAPSAGGLVMLAMFGHGPQTWTPKDCHPGAARTCASAGPLAAPRLPGRPRIYCVGVAYRLFSARTSRPSSQSTSRSQGLPALRQAHYVSVDEGHFDADGNYVVDRRRNGDGGRRNLRSRTQWSVITCD